MQAEIWGNVEFRNLGLIGSTRINEFGHSSKFVELQFSEVNIKELLSVNPEYGLRITETGEWQFIQLGDW